MAELAALAGDEDPLVSQRALDLLEKLARGQPEWIEPHKHLFIGALALDSLATLAQKDPALRSIVLRHLRRFERSGSKALVARARHVRERL